jgi:hypothetical protein
VTMKKIKAQVAIPLPPMHDVAPKHRKIRPRTGIQLPPVDIGVSSAPRGVFTPGHGTDLLGKGTTREFPLRQRRLRRA